ncbi:MAG: hypothetical protein M3H12_18655 [Chromatiales bacterium]
MHKRKHIQQAATYFLPHVGWDLNKAIDYAERLWQRLTERSYGAPEANGPRQSENWYGKLQGATKKQFDAFWNAFNFKQGRDGAAMRWYQLGDLTEQQAKQIIDAARAEAQRPLAPGVSRKMAQGWILERRWDDHKATDNQPPDMRKAEIRVKRSDLAALKRHQEKCPTDAQAKKIEQLESQIQELLRASEA